MLLIISEGRGTVPFEKLKSIYNHLTKVMYEFKKTMQEVRDQHAKQVETLTRERDALLPGPELNGMKKCANCNRAAMAECSLCRRTPYCSTFCQSKDWNAHQVECSHEPLDSTQQIVLMVDEQP